jgi:hypothetical protein
MRQTLRNYRTQRVLPCCRATIQRVELVRRHRFKIGWTNNSEITP